MNIWRNKRPAQKNAEGYETYSDGEMNAGGGKKNNVLTGIKIGIAAVIVAVIAFGSFYKVGEQQQAVITMFGRVVDTKGAGLYGKLPLIQRVHMVDTTTHGLQIGYRTMDETEENFDVPDEALMITSDFNFVNVDFYLEYRVSSPEQYLYASSAPEEILRNTAQACIRTVISNYSVDDVITTGKSQIQADIRDMLNGELQKNDIGLQLVNLTIQDAQPPTEEIMQAFKSVETAKQGKETAVNNAKKYQNEKVPQAEADADKIVQQAEAGKAARISEAEGQVARFNEMYAEYIKNPLITKQRIFYETMEEVLPDAKLIIDDGGTEKLLPLEPFAGITEGMSRQAGDGNTEPAAVQNAEESQAETKAGNSGAEETVNEE